MAVNYVTNFKNNSGTVTLRCTWHFTNEVTNQTYYSIQDDCFAVLQAPADTQIITDITIICEGTNGIDFSETFYANDSTHNGIEIAISNGWTPIFPNVSGDGDAYSQVDNLYIPEEITWLNCRFNSLIDYIFVIRNLNIVGQLEYIEGIGNKFQYVNMTISKIKTLGINTFCKIPAYNLEGTFDSLEVIKDGAFTECKMSDLRPYKLNPSTTIETYAFISCSNLIYFNDDNTIDCNIDNSSGYYHVFYNCPCIELLTFTLNATYNGIKSADAEFMYFEPIIFVELNTGSNINAEGMQKIVINTENFIFKPLRYVNDFMGNPYYKYSMDYAKGNVEAGEYEIAEGFLNILVNGNKIVLRAFADGQIKVVYGDVTKGLRVLDTSDSKASPVRIVLNKEIKALSY